MINEIWKDVIGYEGIYSVSNFGKIRGDLDTINGYKSGRILEGTPDKNGYIRVMLYKNTIQRNFPIHILVARAFIGECPKGMEVNHKDTNKTNNFVDNLEYITHLANVEHAKIMGLCAKNKGENNPMCKIPDSEIPIIFELRKTGLLQKEIASIYGVSNSTICLILKQKSRTYINV